MAFPINSTLLDCLVLAVVEREDTYGYKITQDIQKAIDISESTLYPVLRRLQKDMCLETYDREFMGRNRRYYRITDKGKEVLKNYRTQWQEHKNKIENILYGGYKIMSKYDFLKRLDNTLSPLSKDERDNALKFYEEFINDC